MIADTKPQNIIIIITMILGIISGIGLASSAYYYSGSYTMARYLEVSLNDIRVSNLDPTNHSIDPTLSLYFNIYSPPGAPGDVKISYLTAVVYINNDKINYENFRRDIPRDLRSLYPDYNQTFSVSATLREDADKQLLFDAYDSEEWVISVQLTIFYEVFDQVGTSVRIIAFSWDTPPSGLPF